MTSTDTADLEIPALRTEFRALQGAYVDATRRLKEIADFLRHASYESTDPEVLALYLEVLHTLGSDNYTHLDLAALARRHRMRDLPNVDSFWRQIVLRRRKKQLGSVPEKRLGIDKKLDTDFVQRLGIRTVTTHFRGPFSSLPLLDIPLVIKPTKSSGSRGAFYVYPDKLFSISRSITVSSWADLQALAREELELTDLDSIEWEVQSLVELEGLPAPDLKFYAFYGEIGTVLEASRYPEGVYAYFDASLKPIDFRLDQKPHFEDIDKTSVRRGLLTEDKMARVRDLSLSIPVPFMRIDFLHSDDDLVFCEFSSAPGMSHCLTPEHDERLGKLYAEAEVRLINDLLDGKSFCAAR